LPDELPPLTCTVRGCGLPLHRDGRSLVCQVGHTYDLSRRGYVNLLQPQDRRSSAAGDTPDATRARARLLDAGIGSALFDAVATQAIGSAQGPGGRRPVVVDLGCGSGHLVGLVSKLAPIRAVGLDLSVTAVQEAARRWPHLTWAVANVDRRIPLAERSVDVICSVNARRNPTECERVLAPGGTLLVALPAADDLIELRTHLDAAAAPRPRDDRLLRDHEPWFDLAGRHVVHERHTLERARLLDLLRATYRGERHSAAQRVAALAELEVTLAAEIFVFRPRTRPRG
jgi:23S rRNA (guanine745-N1)-methyltransferase